MTEKDQDLINQAFEYNDGSDWDFISGLIDQAESEEAKQKLKNRRSYLYRKEEQFSGL